MRIDITDRWAELSSSPDAMHRFILDQYGADRSELAPYPHAALYKDDVRLGVIHTDGLPRVDVENDRVYIELSELQKDDG